MGTRPEHVSPRTTDKRVIPDAGIADPKRTDLKPLSGLPGDTMPTTRFFDIIWLVAWAQLP
jgi:hypothetical protein